MSSNQEIAKEILIAVIEKVQVHTSLTQVAAEAGQAYETILDAIEKAVAKHGY